MSLAVIDHLGQPLEIADSLMKLGYCWGVPLVTQAALERDFKQGFAHGVDLARREVCDQ